MSAEASAKVGSRAPPPLRYGGPAGVYEYFMRVPARRETGPPGNGSTSTAPPLPIIHRDSRPPTGYRSKVLNA